MAVLDARHERDQIILPRHVVDIDLHDPEVRHRCAQVGAHQRGEVTVEVVGSDVHLVRVGEEAGDVEGMLLRLADIYDVEVHATVGRFVAVLGPLVILAMGMVIAGLILSILAALLSINELAF